MSRRTSTSTAPFMHLMTHKQGMWFIVMIAERLSGHRDCFARENGKESPEVTVKYRYQSPSRTSSVRQFYYLRLSSTSQTDVFESLRRSLRSNDLKIFNVP
ncbi:hypothetical protein D9758_017528 [Tetrapyrgos nigripes]|uniref:Uncharacterized protein n=1 Tax=Tetrapyrgos nigripes TaxID=182062 RepID=A0A8H5FEM5_9AGAR|nr:hypothetical protein D9758_017528 [Tetrapyrgos nigripes]